LPSAVLPTPVVPKKIKEPIGRLGSCRPACYILKRALKNLVKPFLKHSPVYQGVALVKGLALSRSSTNIYTDETARKLLFDRGIGS
jgi:hypothetical protein